MELTNRATKSRQPLARGRGTISCWNELQLPLDPHKASQPGGSLLTESSDREFAVLEETRLGLNQNTGQLFTISSKRSCEISGAQVCLFTAIRGIRCVHET